MDFLSAVLLGLLEGVTEFLPVSSTGHLLIAGHFLNIPDAEFLKTFTISIQLGAILSVVYLYWSRLWQKETLLKLLTAFLPTAVIGFLLYPLVRGFLLSSLSTVLWAFFLGGLVLIGFEYFYGRKRENETSVIPSLPSYGQAIAIGFFQALAIVPGVSRSAATVIGGLSIGLTRTAIVEFSFLLAIPTMFAATVLDLSQSYNLFSADQFLVLAAGFIVSFVAALWSIKFLLGYVKKHSFIPFGVYRIAVALIFWLIIY